MTTYQAFPLSPSPAWYTKISFDYVARNAIFYVGDEVCFTLSQYGADTCTIRDFYGNIVSTTSLPTSAEGSFGAISSPFVLFPNESVQTQRAFLVKPTPPVGGWNPGWYRIYLTGPNTDSLFGSSYGAANFAVIRDDSNFPKLPSSTPTTYGKYWPSGEGDANTADATQGFDSPLEMITRACLGLGVGRLVCLATTDPTNQNKGDTISANSKVAQVAQDWCLTNTKGGAVDSVRTSRTMWHQFTNFGDWDTIIFNSATSGSLGLAWLYVLPVAAQIGDNQNQIWVGLDAGSLGGTFKITVYYPDSSTAVETYDNLATNNDAQTAMAASAYVRGYANNSVAPNVPQGPIQMPVASRNGIKQIVSTLYPLGVTHYEGPWNEPFGGEESVLVAAQRYSAVKAGNASAKMMGPTVVNQYTAHWDEFFQNGYSSYIDEISFHDYNTFVNCDVNLARNIIEAWEDKLASYSVDTLPRWQTEANHALINHPKGVLHPRQGKWVPFKTMVWEQYGIPFERNPLWYDWSHGFWGYASFMFTSYYVNKSPAPWPILMCVYSQEVFGKLYHHRVDFGCPEANAIFVGNVYGDSAAGSVMALVCASYIPSSSVTLAVDGTAGPLTVVDGFGNESSASLSGGQVTVSVGEIPTYVRLPAGANAHVVSVNDWGSSPSPSVSIVRKSSAIGGLSNPALADGQYMSQYTGTPSTCPGLCASTVTTLPDTAEVLFPQSVTVDRVVVWCGAAWQAMPTMLDYTVDTWDGVSWTTQVTVSKTTPTSFLHGSGGDDWGTQRETYWDEQWIEDVKLPTPVSCQGVRVNVSKLSYGGEPDLAAVTDGTVTISVWAAQTPTLCIQEIAVMSATAITVPSSYTTEVTADTPVGYWRLDESSGLTAVSQVNSPAVDGTYAGSCVLGQPGAISDGDTAVSTGSTGYIQIPDNAVFSFGDTFSLEFWYKPSAAITTFQGLMSKGTSFTWAVGTTTSGNVRLLGGSSLGTVIATSTGTLNVNQWNHVVVTKSGATTHIYLNGVEGTTVGTNVTYTNNTNAIKIGDGANPTKTFDDVAVYNTALSASRVLTHYTAGLFPKAPVSTHAPKLEGSATSGTQLQAGFGRWDGIPTSYTYQWQNSADNVTFADIVGETKSTYVIASQTGKYLRCNVTATNPGGSTTVATASVGPVV